MRCILVPLLFLTTCGGSPVAPDVTFRRIASGSLSSFTRQEVRVARDAAAWNAILSQLRPDSPPERVDFASEMLVVVLLGERPTAGYRVRVDRATSSSSGVLVAATEATPHPTCIVAQVVTQPFDIVAVARRGGDVGAEWQKTTGPPCR